MERWKDGPNGAGRVYAGWCREGKMEILVKS